LPSNPFKNCSYSKNVRKESKVQQVKEVNFIVQQVKEVNFIVPLALAHAVREDVFVVAAAFWH